MDVRERLAGIWHFKCGRVFVLREYGLIFDPHAVSSFRRLVDRAASSGPGVWLERQSLPVS